MSVSRGAHGAIMTQFIEVYSRISDELSEVKERTDAALSRTAALVGCANPLITGSNGKQFRPAMLILVSRLFHGDRDLAIRLAVAVELIHAASLIHDDVIDAAPVRRGQPTAFATVGPSNAVLSGDVIFSDVFKSLAQEGLTDALAEVARAAAEVCAGEVRENRSRHDFAMTRQEYLKIVDLKTASLYRASATLGALSGKADAAAARAAGRFGREVGMAFQVADDLLDVAGRESEIGKPVRRDLIEGRVALPTILYLEGLSDKDRRRSAGRFASGDGPFIMESLDKMAEPKNVAAVRRIAEGYSRRALKLLDKLPIGLEKVSLAALCRFAADRST